MTSVSSSHTRLKYRGDLHILVHTRGIASPNVAGKPCPVRGEHLQLLLGRCLRKRLRRANQARYRARQGNNRCVAVAGFGGVPASDRGEAGLGEGPTDAEKADRNAAPPLILVEDGIKFHLQAKGSDMQPMTVRASAVHDRPNREMLDNRITKTRQHIEGGGGD